MKNLIKIFNLKNPKTLTPTKRKSMEIVILEQPGKFAHMQQCLPLSLDIFPTKVVAALASHCCSSPVGFNHLIPFYTAKHRTFPVLSSFSMPFSWHLPLQWHLTPGLPSSGQQHPMTFLRSLLRALSHHLGGMGHCSLQQAAQKQCQGLFIGRGLQFLAHTITGFLCKEGGKKICSTSMLQFKVTAICIMPERQGIGGKENLRMLFLLSPNILGYKDQTNYQTVLSWAGFTNHALLEELGENLLSRIMKGANKLFSWRVNIIKKIIFYVIFFSSLLIAAWNTFLKHNELQMNSWAINLPYMALEGKLIRWVDAITAIT